VIGLQLSTVDVERTGGDPSPKVVREASASPGPLTIGGHNEDITERNGRVSCSPEARRLDAVIVRDENQGSRLVVF